MNILKLSALSAVLFFSAGCGGVTDGDEVYDSLESELQAPVTQNFQFGTQTGNTHRRCGRSSTGQVCNVFSSKNITQCVNTYPVANAIPDPYFSRTPGLNAVINATTWNVSQGTRDVSGACNPVGTGFRVKNGSCGTAGGAATKFKDYACFSWTGNVTPLDEGQNIVGSVQSVSTCEILIDIDDINAFSTFQSQRNALFDTAYWHAVMGCLGMGERTGSASANTSSTRETIVTGVQPPMLTPGELCVFDNFSATANGQFNIAQISCNDD